MGVDSGQIAPIEDPAAAQIETDSAEADTQIEGPSPHPLQYGQFPPPTHRHHLVLGYYSPGLLPIIVI